MKTSKNDLLKNIVLNITLNLIYVVAPLLKVQVLKSNMCEVYCAISIIFY